MRTLPIGVITTILALLAAAAPVGAAPGDEAVGNVRAQFGAAPGDDEVVLAHCSGLAPVEDACTVDVPAANGTVTLYASSCVEQALTSCAPVTGNLKVVITDNATLDDVYVCRFHAGLMAGCVRGEGDGVVSGEAVMDVRALALGIGVGFGGGPPLVQAAVPPHGEWNVWLTTPAA